MQVHMTEDGTINLIGETGAEDYALQHWQRSALIEINDVARMETHAFRASRIKVILESDCQRDLADKLKRL